MRWSIVIAALAACGDSPSATDAPSTDTPIADTGDGAGNATWESVTEVSNDGSVIVEDVTYRSGDLLIRGRVCRPAADGAHPAFVYNHGGFQGLAIDPEVARCVATAELGYVWVASSYRGEDGSDGRVEVCLGEVDDVLALLAVVRVQSYVEPDRIVMYGGSHGGCITLRAVQRGAQVRAAIDLFGPTDWAALYAFWERRGDPVDQQLMSVMTTATGGTPAAQPAAYAMRSPLTYAADLPADIPLMVTHGANDIVVPASQSCALVGPVTFASWHVDANGLETAVAPDDCAGVPSLTTSRPTGGWAGTRFLLVYDGLGHETASAAAMRMLQDVTTFALAKL